MMDKLMRDLTFLLINTILLAVIAFGVVTNLRIVKSQMHDHRLRNEAENLCQIETIQLPPAEIGLLTQRYSACVQSKSGVDSPIPDGSKK